MLHVSYVVVILAYFLRGILQMQTKLLLFHSRVKSFHHMLVTFPIPKAVGNQGGDFEEKNILKVISSEFPCDGKREFSMGCECGKRNVTDEIEKHCQTSARIEGGGKGSIFFHLGLTPSLTERQNLSVCEISK